MAKRVSVGGLEVEYDEVGAGERPFVLVHGFTGSRDDFADVLAPLGVLGPTLAPDLRGHGGTTKPGDGYALDQLTADLSGFLDAVEIPRCDLLGHSLGGMLALRLTLAEPERVASLVLMDTAARSVGSRRRWMLRAAGRAVGRMPPRWLWRLARAGRGRMPEPMRRAAETMGPERYWERLRVKLEAMDPVAYAALTTVVFEQQPLLQRLSEIRCPTLVVVGEEDATFRAPSSELADGIPDAKLVVLEGAHHSPQIEAQEAWLEAVRAHLERARG